jgi:hypothetical protein
MKILCNRGDIDVYKIDHNYKKVCTMNLYCCQFDLFENALSYFHEIICYCCTNSFEQIYPSPHGRPESPREATEYFTTRFSYPFDYRPLQNE